MSFTEPTVFVLNGDPGTRGGLCELIGSRYLHVVPCGSAGEYLRFPKPDAPGCVIADIDLPDMSGLDLLRNIAATDAPVVFVTGRSEVSCSVRAIKLGALDFMTIPFETAHLLDAIGDAIVHDCNTRARRAVELSLCERYASLTNRERQVLRLVACATSSQPQNWVSVDSPYRYTGARSCKKCRPVRSRTWRGWLKR